MCSRIITTFVVVLLIFSCLSISEARRRSKKPRLPKYTANVTIVKIVDGDTVNVRFLDRNTTRKFRVRLEYIDAPEKAQDYGPEATTALRNLIYPAGANSSSLFRLSVFHHDHYGRLLGVLYKGETDLNRQMVTKGLAWCYRNRCPKPYKRDHILAKRQRLGLFQGANPIKPWVYRRAMRKQRRKNRGRHGNRGQNAGANPPALIRL